MADEHEHSGAEHSDAHGDHGHIETMDMVRVGVTALIAAAVWFRVWEPFPRVSVLGIAGVFFGGWPIFKESIENLRERRMTMELSMTIALISALGIGEFFTALIIALFVLVAEILEGLTVSRGRRAIGGLLDLLPRTAWLVKAGSSVETPIAEIRPGDLILIKPGARVPVDGVVRSGSSTVEEAAITGEPIPRDKWPGHRVFAGTLNQAGALTVAVEELGRDTTFGRIIDAVEKADRTRAPVQRLADQLAGYLVYFALASAAITLMVTHNWRSTISVVIVAGACGIAAGTPLAILGAIGRAARQGAVIKGGIYLEMLSKIDTVLLDKTGTLTLGKPAVVAIEPDEGVTERELLEEAASAERNSEHPLAQAILAAARDRQIAPVEITSFEYTPGKGVRAVVNGRMIVAGNLLHLKESGIADTGPRDFGASVKRTDALDSGASIKRTDVLDSGRGTRVLIARDRRFLGAIRIGDQVREEARDAVAELQAMGLHVALLTGDTQDSANDVARAIGVTDVASSLLPEQKLARVDQAMQAGATVAMVGDGINDAPALARAHVGVAMGSGTEVAHASANVLLIGNDLRRFVEAVKTARWCRRVIFQNLYGTLAVDAVGIALAAMGLLNPLLAAFIHVTSELAFILNSTRLLPRD